MRGGGGGGCRALQRVEGGCRGRGGGLSVCIKGFFGRGGSICTLSVTVCGGCEYLFFIFLLTMRCGGGGRRDGW